MQVTIKGRRAVRADRRGADPPLFVAICLARRSRPYAALPERAHRVAVRARDFPYTLDGLLIEQGHAIVAETYRHKCLAD